ncbi:MAG: hypothetical protein P8P99_01540 [Maricaulis sp.]|nr:hypothetical protein [Maricaulis sp.]
MIASTLLGTVHFWIGCTAMGAGFSALISRKGHWLHRKAGLVFLSSMLLLTFSGLWLSLERGILFAIFLAAIAFHAVVTAWSAVRLETRLGRFVTRYGVVFSGVIVSGAVWGGLKAAKMPDGLLNGLPAEAFLILAGLTFLMMLLDAAFAFNWSSQTKNRIIRYLWRMGFAFFLATGIFFFGNNHVLPEAMRHELVLSIPVIAVVLWTLYYAIRIRFEKRPVT